MSDFKLSRRSVMQVAGGAAALAGAGLPATSFAGSGASTASEIDAARHRIGTRFHASDGISRSTVILEDVLELAPRVRPPFHVSHRTPFALVFRHDGGDTMDQGTYRFTAADVPGQVLMVSPTRGADGIDRLEAVFN